MSSTVPSPSTAANQIAIFSLDNVTVNGKSVGSITNAIANKNATPSELHAALKSFVAAQVSQASDHGAGALSASQASELRQLGEILAKPEIMPSDIVTAQQTVANLQTPIRQRKVDALKKKAADLQTQIAAAEATGAKAAA